MFSPFVVFGPSKSGTTWLQKCLNSHPEVSCKFQIPIFPILDNKPLLFPVSNKRKRILSQSRIVFNAGRSAFKGVFETKLDEDIYQNRLKFISEMSGVFQEHIKVNRINGARNRREIELTQLLIKNFAQGMLRDDGDKKILGTKAYTDLGKFFEIFPKSKVIVIFRDGRDVAVSKRFHLKRLGAYFIGDEKNSLLRYLHLSKTGRRFSSSILVRRLKLINESHFSIEKSNRIFCDEALMKITKDWKLCTEYLLEWMEVQKENMLPVYYENLLTDPEKELAKALNFIGAKSDHATIENIISKNSFKKMKNKETTNSFFRSGRFGEWKEHFVERDKDLFKSIAGGVLIKLGYENDTKW